MDKPRSRDFENELKVIQQLRKNVYQLDTPILIMLFLGLVSTWIIPSAAIVFGVLAFIFFYKKLRYTAHYPCPRCGSPFGTEAKIVLGVGSDSCQNCNLKINE